MIVETSVLASRILLAGQLIAVCAGSLLALICETRMSDGALSAALLIMVVAPFATAAVFAGVAYQQKWSKSFSAALLLATIAVAGLSSWIYVDVAFGSHKSSTEELVFLFVPIYGFVVGGVVLVVMLGCVRRARFFANR